MARFIFADISADVRLVGRSAEAPLLDIYSVILTDPDENAIELSATSDRIVRTTASDFDMAFGALQSMYAAATRPDKWRVNQPEELSDLELASALDMAKRMEPWLGPAVDDAEARSDLYDEGREGFGPIEMSGRKSSLMMGSGALLDPVELQKGTQAWEWKDLDAPGWKILIADHVVLRGDVSVELLRTIGAQVETYLGILREAIGGGSSEIMFNVRVFGDPKEFRKFATSANAANAEAYYDPRTRELVLDVDGSRGDEWLERTVAHEFTHAYMDRIFNVISPLWFAEGMAEYFTNLQVGRGGRLHPGALNEKGLGILSVNMKDLLPLNKFVALGRDVFYGMEFHLLYAQAWMFTRFLFDRHPDLIGSMLERKGIDAGTLEEEWNVYLSGMLGMEEAA